MPDPVSGSKVLRSGAPRRKPPNAGKGRKKGVPNKLTGDIRQMILAALDDAGGREYLRQQATRNPAAFMSLLGKIVPRDVLLDATVEVAGSVAVYLPDNGRQRAG